MENRLPRKLAAILYADVAGYSRLTGEDEDATHRTLSEYLDLISSTIESHSGQVIHYAGDAVLARFDAVVDALSSAVTVQNEINSRNQEVPERRKVQFRVGVNLGDVIEDRGDIYGDGVNVAARLESLAEPGGVCVSEAVRSAVGSKLPLDFDFMGEQEVKNIAEPVRAYRTSLTLGATLPPPAPPRKKRLYPKYITAIAAVIVLFISVGALTWFSPWEKQETPHLDRPSLAVLPFANFGDDPTQEQFADGMTDDLITDLSKISGLLVIARHSVFAYKGKSLPVQQVANELGVRHVLEGSVRRTGEQIRINVQLIDAATGGHLWAERYDSDNSNVFALQDRVIREIVSALEVKLTDAEGVRLTRLPTSNLEAYDYYQRAERSIRGFRGGEVADAMALYQQAVALDPEFADAHAGYGLAAYFIWRRGVDDVMPGPIARKLAYESASKALEADPDNSRAFSVLAQLQVADGRYEQALESAQHATTLAPNNAGAYISLANVQVVAGQPTEALVAMQTAFRLDPKPPPWFHTTLGRVLFFNHRFEEAVQSLEKGVEGDSGDFRVLAMAYAQLGRNEEARALIDRILQIVPFDSVARARTRYAHYKRKEDRELRLESLGKAGLPEWPFGYQASEEDLLAADAVETLTVGRIWVGYSRNGGDFVQQFTQDRQVAYRNAGALLTGTAWDDEGMLCVRYPAINMGQASCGFLFQNPDGTIEERNEYVYLNASDVSYFSVKP